MATTPIDNPNGFRAVKCIYDCPPPVISVIATNSQTIAAGDAVIASGGYAAIALYTSGQLLGVAAEPVTTAVFPVNTIWHTSSLENGHPP